MQYPTRGDNVKYDKVIRKCLDLCDINIMLYISTHTKLFGCHAFDSIQYLVKNFYLIPKYSFYILSFQFPVAIKCIEPLQ